MRRLIVLLAAYFALALLLVLPASADALTYCVNTTGCDVDKGSDFQDALTTAAAHPGEDTVKLGSPRVNRAGGFSYNNSEIVHIEGNGGRGFTPGIRTTLGD